jgi:hypothetical protein
VGAAPGVNGLPALPGYFHVLRVYPLPHRGPLMVRQAHHERK